MSLPQKLDRRDEAVEFFSRHLISLSISYRIKNEGAAAQPRFSASSGTLIETGGRVFYLTAGHVISDIEEAEKNPAIEVLNAVLADNFGSDRKSDLPIPFVLSATSRYFVDDEILGLDFGVIELAPYYVRLLKANGAVVLTEERWNRQSNVSFDKFAMLGLPQEFISERITEEGQAVVMPTMFSLERIEAPPDAKATTYTRFVGKISNDLPLRSVKGMSGGPIFGFRTEPELRYWIVALQSTWRRDDRVVFGCPLPTIGTLLAQKFTSVDEN